MDVAWGCGGARASGLRLTQFYGLWWRIYGPGHGSRERCLPENQAAPSTDPFSLLSFLFFPPFLFLFLLFPFSFSSSALPSFDPTPTNTHTRWVDGISWPRETTSIRLPSRGNDAPPPPSNRFVNSTNNKDVLCARKSIPFFTTWHLISFFFFFFFFDVLAVRIGLVSVGDRFGIRFSRFSGSFRLEDTYRACAICRMR